MQKILCVDLANMFWLARARHTHEGSLKGGWPVVQQWLYTFNLWIKTHRPDAVIFLGDGYPKWRYEKHEDYKAGRKEKAAADPMTPEFIRQKKDIKRYFFEALPVYYLYHEALEADDLFYIVCKHFNDISLNCEIIGISTDDDWRQMMQRYANVKLWTPIKKIFKPAPDCDFIKFKAILGDSSDNIPGFDGVGKVTAKKLCLDENKFHDWHAKLTPGQQERYTNNLFLVDSSQVPQVYYDDFIKCFDNYDFPRFSAGFLKTYCESKRLFRYLKNFQEKADNFKSLKPIDFYDKVHKSKISI